jgi:hypothetical protein
LTKWPAYLVEKHPLVAFTLVFSQKKRYSFVTGKWRKCGVVEIALALAIAHDVLSEENIIARVKRVQWCSSQEEKRSPGRLPTARDAFGVIYPYLVSTDLAFSVTI